MPDEKIVVEACEIAKTEENGNRVELWNRFCKTDINFVKAVALGGYKYTAINPQYQAMNATALWGPYGIAWGLRNCKYEFVGKDGELPDTVILHAEFFYPTGNVDSIKALKTGDTHTGENVHVVGIVRTASFEISVDMGYKKNDDVMKKLRTQAQSKSLAMLGFNADVFLALFDEVDRSAPGGGNRGIPSKPSTGQERNEGVTPSKGRAFKLAEKNKMQDYHLLAYVVTKSNGEAQRLADLGEKAWQKLCDQIEDGTVKQFCENNPDKVEEFQK